MSCERFPVGSPGFASRLRRVLRTGKRTMDLDVITDLTPTFDVRHLLEPPRFVVNTAASGAAGVASVLVFSVQVGTSIPSANMAENVATRRTFFLKRLRWRQATDAVVRAWIAEPDNNVSVVGNRGSHRGRMTENPAELSSLLAFTGTAGSGFTTGGGNIIAEATTTGGLWSEIDLPGGGLVVPWTGALHLVVSSSVQNEIWRATAEWEEPLIRNLQLADLERTEPEV